MDGEGHIAEAQDTERVAFGPFTVDFAERQLRREDAPVELGSRYFDALALMLRHPGALVSKDRFMDEVWRGVPVTDEALTQCIRTLRRALDDDAGNPAYIATVPKHGYRFVGELDAPGEERAAAPPLASFPARIATAATLGGAMAGLGGGLLYGLLATLAGGGADEGRGGSAVLALTALCLAVGVLGGFGTGLGMAAASAWRGKSAAWLAAGGAVGGMLTGALGRVVGLDLFSVIAGIGVGPVTGLFEGAAIGALAGAGCALAKRYAGRGGLGFAALAGAAGGALVALAGGRLMAGSLVLLERAMSNSRLSLEGWGAFFGESGFGTLTLVATSALEAAVFVTCVAWAVRRSARGRADRSVRLDRSGKTV